MYFATGQGEMAGTFRGGRHTFQCWGEGAGERNVNFLTMGLI